jgi:hypothetical protein
MDIVKDDKQTPHKDKTKKNNKQVQENRKKVKMKRGRKSYTITTILEDAKKNNYKHISMLWSNKRNSHKFIIVQCDKCYHWRIKQIMKFDNGVENLTGDGIFHRIHAANLNELLADYNFEKIIK